MTVAVKTILIIDDDPDILISTSSMLKKRGFNVIEAKSAEDGLSILKDRRPDLILTDVLLPQMNGFELVKQIRQSPLIRGIPILVITGRGHMKESFDILGVEGFISKPFTPEALVQRIDNILEIHHIREEKTDTQQKNTVLVVGQSQFRPILDEIVQTISQLGFQGMFVTSVPEAMAKMVEHGLSVLLVDVQLEGKPAADLVNMVRHLPGYEETIIIGFSYYRIDQLSDGESRKKILNIESNSQLFLKAGANHYMGRYSQELLISIFKTEILKKNERIS
ncbi:MAG TPA: response regulator [Candidatus Bathyarchaeia archaeon]|nr:response regulator [Candidatus Bathyarchaeia archaeon]